jgi:uncharacterized phage infection (PIP) family protein YhgE
MPCTKCEEGNYKWGKTGECEYASKEACESANHKYNKMQPTPLGKKSYEEYAKELKEYNLSSSKRIELSVVSELKSINQELRKALDQLEKSGNDADGKADKYFKTIQDTKGKAKQDTNKIEKLMDEVVRASKVAKGIIKDAETAAKELGLNPNEIPNFSELSDAEADVKTVGNIGADAIDALYEVIDN